MDMQFGEIASLYQRPLFGVRRTGAAIGAHGAIAGGVLRLTNRKASRVRFAGGRKADVKHLA
jgi:hypothetical protein